MTKTPYEIRLDVLKMAQDMIEREKNIEQDVFYQKLDTLKVENPPSEMIRNFIDSNSPKMYSSDEVISRASQLYNFVENKKQ